MFTPPSFLGHTHLCFNPILFCLLPFVKSSPPLTDGCFAGPPEAMLPPPRVRAPRGVALQIDAQTESNHDTAPTLAAQGGHDELVQVLLAHGSDREHRDKKGVCVWVYVCTHIRTCVRTYMILFNTSQKIHKIPDILVTFGYLLH